MTVDDIANLPSDFIFHFAAQTTPCNHRNLNIKIGAQKHALQQTQTAAIKKFEVLKATSSSPPRQPEGTLARPTDMLRLTSTSHDRYAT